jgi:hypothetical protein
MRVNCAAEMYLFFSSLFSRSGCGCWPLGPALAVGGVDVDDDAEVDMMGSITVGLDGLYHRAIRLMLQRVLSKGMWSRMVCMEVKGNEQGKKWKKRERKTRCERQGDTLAELDLYERN